MYCPVISPAASIHLVMEPSQDPIINKTVKIKDITFNAQIQPIKFHQTFPFSVEKAVKWIKDLPLEDVTRRDLVEQLALRVKKLEIFGNVIYNTPSTMDIYISEDNQLGKVLQV